MLNLVLLEIPVITCTRFDNQRQYNLVDVSIHVITIISADHLVKTYINSNVTFNKNMCSFLIVLWIIYCFSFCPFCFVYCIVCPSICGFGLPLWYFQTLFLGVEAFLVGIMLFAYEVLQCLSKRVWKTRKKTAICIRPTFGFLSAGYFFSNFGIVVQYSKFLIRKNKQSDC